MRIGKRHAKSIRAGIIAAKSVEWLGPRHMWMLTTRDKLAYRAYKRYEAKYWERKWRRTADRFWREDH